MLKFGIIGCGRIAHRHAAHMKNHGKLEIVYDIIPEKTNAFGKKYQAKSIDSEQAFFKSVRDIDLIAVCTPNGLHAEHSILSMMAGCHVLCEKPMAISIDSGKKMKLAAKEYRKKLFIVKQNRFNPPVIAIKELLNNETLGKVYSIQVNCFWNRDSAYYHNSWKGTMKLDGGTLYTQFSHFIDLLYWMFGDLRTAIGYSANYHHKGVIEFEDTGAVSLFFENGIIGTLNYTVNSRHKNMEGSVTIFAEKGTVKIGGQYLNELEYQSIDNQVIQNLERSKRPNNYGHYQGSMSNHDKVYQNIVDVLNNNANIATNAADGLKTIEIIEKIYAAIR